MITVEPTIQPVRRSITVKASPERAFRVYTAEYDSWWPRTHHIGKSPMKKAILECRAGGRCYSEQEDGTECDWGKVLTWEPPVRFVIAWQITHEWGYEPDLSKSSEVEIRFTPLSDGTTRVDLEHRHLERHGAGAASMRKAVDSEGGWGTLLNLYTQQIEKSSDQPGGVR
ncbi:MAG TPA: SRPBCC family protein [Acidobacteriota bacterium]|nr:SRPBCC family protein [Acidobacteriota bacterium]